MAHTVYHALAAAGRDRGSASAILAPGRRTLGHAELLAQIERVGDHLAAAGLGHASRVGVALPQSPEAAAAIVAILSWTACCPINPRLDEHASAALLPRLGIDALVAWNGEESGVTRACRTSGIPILRLTMSPENAAGVFSLVGHSDPQDRCAKAPPEPHDLATIMYTSGTTSVPKVVPISHQNLLWRVSQRRLSASDRSLFIGPLFSGSAINVSLIEPLFAGGSVIVCPDSTPASILLCIRTLAPTYYSANPVIHRGILEALEGKGGPRGSTLRFIRSSTGPLQRSLQRELEEAFGVPVSQGYGMTETGVIAQNPLPGTSVVGSVGLASGIEIQIVGEGGAIQPANVQGEVRVRGPGVIRGYENAPDENRRAFRDGWFMTGDVGYLNDEGYLFLAGRIKEIINRGGTKVSPAEVDEVLATHPAIREAATFGVKHATLGEDVVAAAALREPAMVTEEELRAFALARLAPYKVPTRVIIVEALPRSPIGKVVRSELENLYARLGQVSYEAPRNAREELVAGVFSEALGSRAAVGRNDNFFQLGGDSLRGAELVSRLNAKLGANLAPGSLFEHPTVAQFCACLDSDLRSGQMVPPAITPRRRGEQLLGERGSMHVPLDPKVRLGRWRREPVVYLLLFLLAGFLFLCFEYFSWPAN